MKALFCSKTLIVALIAIGLTACGGSSSKKTSTSSTAASSTPASVAESSAPASSADASSIPASSVAASSTPASVAASSVDASSSSTASSSAQSAAMVIYEDAAIPAWHAWDCCGGTTPAVVVSSDVDHGQVTEFSITNSTVVGFTSRTADGAVGGAAFNATSIKTTGTISFDLRMTQAPTAGVVAWKLKIESTGAATNAEVNLSTSQEGHTAPVLNTWQTYTFNISALETAGLDVSKMDLFMVFPAWGSGAGAHFQIDNMKIFSTGAN